MQRLLTLLFTILYICPLALAQEKGRQQVSILTCSPGEQVYELFGHTALRVVDEQRGVDAVFNYGLFSFDEPNFIWRFVLGETDYLLGATDYCYFIAEYAERGSGVTEQVLNLDSLQTAALIRSLTLNAMPQHRKYRYNFLFNNCTTKARDKIVEALGGDAGIEYATASMGDSLTFRDIIHIYTAGCPWYQLGMDMLLGAPADEIAARSGAQFAPFVLMDELSDATIVGTQAARPLVAAQHQLLVEQPRTVTRNNLTPFNVALLLLLFTFVVMLCERRSKRSFLLWDVFLMMLQGLAGCVLLFMVLFSQHPAVGCNWLLLWLNPVPLILLPLLLRAVYRDASMNFLWIQVAMPLIFFLNAPFIGQSFPAPLFLCAVVIIIRSLFYIYKKNICALD